MIHKNDLKGWLQSNFGDVSIEPAENNLVEVRLPEVFSLRECYLISPISGKRLTELALYVLPTSLLATCKTMVVPKGVKALGATEAEAVRAVYDRLLELAALDDNEISRVKLKPGQSLDGVNLDDVGEIIHFDDFRHDHKSNKLLDFNILGINPRNNDVDLLDFEENHSHIWIGDNSPAV